MFRRPSLLPVVAALVFATPCAAAAPRSFGTDLELAACGERGILFVDLYAVALYLPPGRAGVEAVRDADVPKAVRIEPTYGGELPSELPGAWRRRVEGELPPDQMALLERLFASMTAADVATIVYRPGEGTTLAIGDEILGRTGDGLLIHAVLGIWLDPDYPLDLTPGECRGQGGG
jgi:hypothetical protein